MCSKDTSQFNAQLPLLTGPQVTYVNNKRPFSGRDDSSSPKVKQCVSVALPSASTANKTAVTTRNRIFIPAIGQGGTVQPLSMRHTSSSEAINERNVISPPVLIISPPINQASMQTQHLRSIAPAPVVIAPSADNGLMRSCGDQRSAGLRGTLSALSSCGEKADIPMAQGSGGSARIHGGGPGSTSIIRAVNNDHSSLAQPAAKQTLPPPLQQQRTELSQLMPCNDTALQSLATNLFDSEQISVIGAALPRPLLNTQQTYLTDLEARKINTFSTRAQEMFLKPRKPCNCTKSMCLKLYCDCFAAGQYCRDCHCISCFNNKEHHDERQSAVKSCLERNPNAFKPKIGKGEHERRHQKGCHCRKSGCLKNYCECYEAKILCSKKCKCIGCKNWEEPGASNGGVSGSKSFATLAEVADMRHRQLNAIDSKLGLQVDRLCAKPRPSSGERPAYLLISDSVIEATCECLLAQAAEAERLNVTEAEQERLVLTEFSRCVQQIIGVSQRSAAAQRAPSPSNKTAAPGASRHAAPYGAPSALDSHSRPSIDLAASSPFDDDTFQLFAPGSSLSATLL